MARGRPKEWTKERIVEALKSEADDEGFVGYKTIGGGLRGAAEREFGSWREACEAAGVRAKGRGRPTGTSERAVCPKCGDERATRKDGTFFKHSRTLKNGNVRVCENSNKSA